MNASCFFFFHLSHKIVSGTQFSLSLLIPWLVLWVMWYLRLININMWWLGKQPNTMQSRGDSSHLNNILLFPQFWRCNFLQDCCFLREMWGENTLKWHLWAILQLHNEWLPITSFTGFLPFGARRGDYVCDMFQAYSHIFSVQKYICNIYHD